MHHGTMHTEAARVTSRLESSSLTKQDGVKKVGGRGEREGHRGGGKEWVRIRSIYAWLNAGPGCVACKR